MATPAVKPQVTPLQSVEMQELERKISKAKSLLILDHPFFGSTVSKRPFVYTYEVPTAACSKRGTIYINPSFVFPLRIQQIVFLLAHEALHYMLMHGLRMGHRLHHAWNIACDKVINDTLTDAKVGEFIDGGVQMRDARNYAAEELYDEDDDGGGQGPGGIGNDVGVAPEDDKPMDESEAHEIEAQVKIETIQSAKAAKAVGKLPASIERMIDEMVAIKTPWHEILERFMTGRIKDGYSWKRPNRRFIGRQMYIPGNDYIPRMGPIAIGVDTSGSIGQRELNEFNAHINRILETCGPEKVIVIYCDAAVNHVDTFEPDDFPVMLHPHGGGGTSFKPVFEHIETLADEVECLVYLTDGYGDQNSIKDPGYYPTVWLTTGREDFDFGTVVKFESGEEN